jgi:hypothetical protein
MKPLNFTVTAPRPRRHRELFDRDLPFQPRRQTPKVVYRRRAKHRAQELE